jgi:UDP-glucose 4-epimerase
VGDVAQALAGLSETESAEGAVFNIGSDEEVSINELAELVKEVTGSESPIVHMTYENAYGRDFEDMRRRVPDLRKIRATIGYAPTKSLRQIVEAVTENFRELGDLRLSAPDLVPVS